MAEPRIKERHDLVTTERAARMAGLSRVSIVNHLLAGKLGAERIGDRFFPYRIEVEALAKERAAAASGAFNPTSLRGSTP